MVCVSPNYRKASSLRPSFLGETTTLRGEQLSFTVFDIVPPTVVQRSLCKRAHWAKCGAVEATPLLPTCAAFCCRMKLGVPGCLSNPWRPGCCVVIEKSFHFLPVPAARYRVTPSQRLLLFAHRLRDRAPRFVQFCLCLIFISSVPWP